MVSDRKQLNRVKPQSRAGNFRGVKGQTPDVVAFATLGRRVRCGIASELAADRVDREGVGGVDVSARPVKIQGHVVGIGPFHKEVNFGTCPS